jgi:hypothetical protein
MMWSSAKRILLLSCFACLAMVLTTRAQNVGSLSGTVTDPSGAAIAGAKVTISDQGSGLSRTVESDKNGEYNFAQLNPGTYKLEVVKDRFRTFIAERVSVLVATPTQVTVKLELGAISEQVIVESAAPALNTQDASVGNVVDEQEVKSLPFLARNVVNLLTMQPGVVFTGMSDTDRLSMGSVETLDSREGVVNGMRGNQTNVTLDGVDSNDWQNQAAFTSALPVTLDSVQEFRVTTTNSNATNGLVGGAEVQLVTKSGTNDFHGNARWYYRTTGTSANSFFNNSTDVPRPKLQRNIGGGSLGGPIKKDRLYFFVDNEERRDATAVNESRIVPSDSLRDGVLEYACAPVLDPSGNVTQTPQQVCPGTTVPGISSSHTIGAGFNGLGPSKLKSLDPAALGINPAMLKYMALFPSGNDPTQGLDAPGNGTVLNFEGFRFNAPELTYLNTYIARIDYNLTKNGKHSIFWRGNLEGLKTDIAGAQFPGQSAASQLLNNSRGFAVQYQGQLSPNLINTARYGFTRLGVAQSGTIGPLFDVRSYTDVLNFGERPVGRAVPVHEINDDVSWSHGKHTIQFGGVARVITNHRTDDANSFPAYSINNGFCVSLCNNVANEVNATGSGFPASTNPTAITRSFMMLTGSITQVNATVFGNPSTGAIQPAGSPDLRNFAERSYEGYVQDSWRLRSNLTLTLGLRYSYETPVWETNGFEVRPSVDIMQWFHQREINMNAGIPSSASPLLSWVPAGKANKGANSWYDPNYKDIGPRVALAYTPGFTSGLLGSVFGGPGKSSIRLGAGIYYDNMGQVIALDSDSQGSPGTSTALINNSTQFTLATAPRFSGSCTATGCTGLPPAGPPFFTPPTSATFPFTPPATASFTGFSVDPHLKTPQSFHLTLSVQRELPHGVVLDVAYVGVLGRRLLGKTDFGAYEDIRDPKSGVDLYSAFRQLARVGNLTPTSGPNIDPSAITNLAGLKTIQSIPFFENMLPNLPAFAAGFDCDPSKKTFATCVSNTESLTPTQAFYSYVFSNYAPSWGCALYPLDAIAIPGSNSQGLPSPWNTTVDPNGTGLVLFQQQFQTLPGWTNFGNSNFHSVQVSVRKNVGIALIGGNYVFSKSLDNSSTGENGDIAAGGGTLSGIIQNPFDLRDGRALSDFNLKHNFNGFWVVDLPFGKGRKYFTSANRLADAAVGGWELTGALRWRSGFPFGPGDGFNFATNFFLTSSGTWTGPTSTGLTRDAVRSDGSLSGPNIFTKPDSTFANDIAFTLPGLAGSRNIMSGPGYFTTDMGLYKTFKITERQRLQFRVTAYNLFNTVNFDDTTISVDPTSPGTFGNITGTAGPRGGAREMEFAIRFEF